MCSTKCPDNCPCAEAYRALNAWAAEHDPDGEMDLLDQIDAYAASMLEATP